jgi:hypothetical protein
MLDFHNRDDNAQTMQPDQQKWAKDTIVDMHQESASPAGQLPNRGRVRFAIDGPTVTSGWVENTNNVSNTLRHKMDQSSRSR